MRDDLETLLESLELSAESETDITQDVFARFFGRDADAAELMGHTDAYMRGRMLEQVIELVANDDLVGVDSYLGWELDNHATAYGVGKQMYRPLLESLRDAVENAAGARWRPRHAQAWGARIEAILGAIEAAST